MEAWKNSEIKKVFASELSIGSFNLSQLTTDILLKQGLPSEFQDLKFNYLLESPVQTVNKKWNLNNVLFNDFIAIGSNGSGDPISLKRNNEELVYLNHDNNFEEVIINSDLKCFLQSILKANDFFNQLTKLTPESFFETEFSDDSFNNLIKDLTEIDVKALQSNNSYWITTLENLKWERDDERKNS